MPFTISSQETERSGGGPILTAPEPTRIQRRGETRGVKWCLVATCIKVGTLTLVSVVDEAPEQLVADVTVLYRREAILGRRQQRQMTFSQTVGPR